MSGYGYGKRDDPPARLIPADQPLNRVGSPAHHDSRKGQRAAGQGHIGDVSAGIIRSERSDFIIDLDGALLEVEDRQTNPVTRVRLGRLGSNPTDYGIEIYLPNGEPLFAAGGLAEDSVGADQLAADSVAAHHLQALHIEVGKFIRSSNFSSGSAGWAIDGNGNAEFNDVTVRGVLDGATGTYEGNLVAAGGTFEGNLTAAGGTFGGTLQAVDGHFHGSLVAVSGTFSTITAGVLSGQAIVLDLNATGSSSVLEGQNFVLRADGSLVLGNHLAVDTSGNITFTGTLEGVGGTFTGDLQANSISLRDGGGTIRGSIELVPSLEGANYTFKDGMGNEALAIGTSPGVIAPTLRSSTIRNRDNANLQITGTPSGAIPTGGNVTITSNYNSQEDQGGHITLDAKQRAEIKAVDRLTLDGDDLYLLVNNIWIYGPATFPPNLVGNDPVNFLQVRVGGSVRFIPLYDDGTT